MNRCTFPSGVSANKGMVWHEAKCIEDDLVGIQRRRELVKETKIVGRTHHVPGVDVRYIRSASRNHFRCDHQMRINGVRLVLAPEIR